MRGAAGPADDMASDKVGGKVGDSRASQASVSALQDALAAEEAASYGYGIVGAHLTGFPRQFSAASADCVAHEQARDSLVGMLTARGAAPRPAAVAYRLPVKVSTAAQAVSLAIILERQVESAYLGLVAVPDPALRAFGAEQIQAAAVRYTWWSGHSQAFPGLPPSSAR